MEEYCCDCLFFQWIYLGFLCSAKATDEYELARQKVANFINASECREIVFTRNATEAINLVAYSWGLSNLKEGDEVWNLPFATISFPIKRFASN